MLKNTVFSLLNARTFISLSRGAYGAFAMARDRRLLRDRRLFIIISRRLRQAINAHTRVHE